MSIPRMRPVEPIAEPVRRRLEKAAPRLWAEQERRREMLQRQAVTVTYRRAVVTPPEGELRRLILSDTAQDADDRRELRFVVENYIKQFLPKGYSFRRTRGENLDRIMRVMQHADTWVADVGGGVVLGSLQIEAGSLVHCLYVKRDFRGLGIGLGLLRAAGAVLPLVTEQATISWKQWCRRHGIPWSLGADKFNWEQT